MSQNNDFLPALKREWLVVRIVVAVGLVLALGLGIYLALGARARIVSERQKAEQQIAAQNKVQAQMTAAKDNFCPAALSQAKGWGALPAYAILADKLPRATKIKGRYLCIAATNVAYYAVVADFVCPDLKQARCLSLFAVAQAGKHGGLIYKRKG